MLHAGLDLSRRKIDVCLLSGSGEQVDQLVAPPDADALRSARQAHRRGPWGAGLRGDRVDHRAHLVAVTVDGGWAVRCRRAIGLAPLACKTDKSTRWCWRLELADLVPRLAARPAGARGGELARFRLHLVKHKSALKNRVHSTLINFGKPCPVTDLFGVEGRALLARLQVPEPWRGNITASVELIDDLEDQIAEINRKPPARATPSTPSSRC